MFGSFAMALSCLISCCNLPVCCINDPRVKRDLDRADAESIAFEQAHKGKLAELAARPDAGATLAEAVRRYEQLEDLLGRVGSFAGLVHAENTLDPARGKFFGDVQ